MRDFFNQPLEVGDIVAFIPNGYRDLVRGRIVAFTPKQVRIGWQDQYHQYEETLRYPKVIVKDLMGGYGGVAEHGG